MWRSLEFSANLVTFAEEILNGRLIFWEVTALYWTDSGIEDSLNAGMWNNKHTAKI